MSRLFILLLGFLFSSGLNGQFHDWSEFVEYRVPVFSKVIEGSKLSVQKEQILGLFSHDTVLMEDIYYIDSSILFMVHYDTNSRYSNVESQFIDSHNNQLYLKDGFLLHLPDSLYSFDVFIYPDVANLTISIPQEKYTEWDSLNKEMDQAFIKCGIQVRFVPK
jgi:hypothetical protein